MHNARRERIQAILESAKYYYARAYDKALPNKDRAAREARISEIKAKAAMYPNTPGKELYDLAVDYPELVSRNPAFAGGIISLEDPVLHREIEERVQRVARNKQFAEYDKSTLGKGGFLDWLWYLADKHAKHDAKPRKLGPRASEAELLNVADETWKSYEGDLLHILHDEFYQRFGLRTEMSRARKETLYNEFERLYKERLMRRLRER